MGFKIVKANAEKVDVERALSSLTFSIALKQDKLGVEGVWIVDGSLTTEVGGGMTITRIRSPHYCVFRGG